MHSVDLLEEAIRVAMNCGVEVRQEWLHEKGGGACRIGDRWVVYIDLSLPAQDQLAQFVDALCRTPPLQRRQIDSETLLSLLQQLEPRQN